MPADVKCTLFFNDHNSLSGWSESYLVRAPQTLAEAQSKAEVLASKRVQLLGSGITLDYIRCSDLLQKRATQVSSGIEPNQPNQVGGGVVYNQDYQGRPADFSYSVVKYRTESGELFHGTRPLGGSPDHLQFDNEGNISDPAWNNKFNIFANKLKDGFGMRVIDIDNATNPNHAITNITNAGGLSIQCPAHGLVSGDKARISGVKVAPDSPNVNGIWQVIVDTANSFTLIGWSGTVAYLSGGVVRKVLYRTVPITKVFLRNFGEHKRGRVFTGRAGGRSARR